MARIPEGSNALIYDFMKELLLALIIFEKIY